VTQYHILVDNNDDWSTPEVDISTGNTAYTVPSALGDGRYYWAVQGRNTSGSCNEYGAWSDVWVLDIDTQGSPAPTLYSPSNGSSITDTTPTFNWSAVSNTQQYQLQVDDNSNFASPVIYITQSNSNYTATSSLNGTYYWRVRAQDTVGNWGNWSSIWSFTIIDFEEIFLPFVIR
jgi:hypothetical protein